jgi:peptide/nickel transport system ATP-binding protein
MGLLPSRGVRIGGRADYLGRDLLTRSDAELARMRGRDLAMVFQDPMTSLNPVLPVGKQVVEVLRAHTDLDRAAAREQAVELLRQVGIPDPGRRVGEYPHQLSGGMRQRAMIAIALACRPRLLIADEPTTALDVTIQAQVLELLAELVADTGTAMIMITHDLGVVAGLCDEVNVMYSGRIVENASRRELFGHPRHRYTHGLLASIPRLDAPRGEPLKPIPGTPRDTIAWSKACAFSPRCSHVVDACRSDDLPLAPDEQRPDHLVRCANPAPVAGDQGGGQR